MEALNDFDLKKRESALTEYIGVKKTKSSPSVNLHTHTFYSYNALGWSPTRYAVECFENDVDYTGIIDFDTLEGLHEFYNAGELLSLRTTVGFETRSFYQRFKSLEIDSPGEPGVHYIAGAGFYKLPQKGCSEDDYLNKLRAMADNRNQALVKRINSCLPEIAISYEKDVLSTTPGGTPTERHIISVYSKRAKKHFEIKGDSKYWQPILKLEIEELERLFHDTAKLEDKMRSALAKKGGVAYEQPDENTFPATEEVWAWVKACGAIPTESWLDGTSAGEQLGKELLESSIEIGARALNIIPDRNWNIKDEKEKALKVKNLNTVIQNAVALDLPLHIGTEGNKLGLRFIDDLNVSALKPHKEHFIKGAQIITGHALLGRFVGFSYLCEDADREFINTTDKNIFFAAVGALPGLNKIQADRLRLMVRDKGFSSIVDSVKAGYWLL